MAGERVVYRIALSRVLVQIATPLLAAAIFLVDRFIRYPDSPAPYVAALIVAVLIGSLLVLALRGGTVVDDTGIEVRHPFGGRHYPWREITDIQVLPMRNVGTLTGTIFVAGGRQVHLPQVTEVIFGAGLEDEVEDLRARWEEALDRP